MDSQVIVPSSFIFLAGDTCCLGPHSPLQLRPCEWPDRARRQGEKATEGSWAKDDKCESKREDNKSKMLKMLSKWLSWVVNVCGARKFVCKAKLPRVIDSCRKVYAARKPTRVSIFRMSLLFSQRELKNETRGAASRPSTGSGEQRGNKAKRGRNNEGIGVWSVRAKDSDRGLWEQSRSDNTEWTPSGKELSVVWELYRKAEQSWAGGRAGVLVHFMCEPYTLCVESWSKRVEQERGRQKTDNVGLGGRQQLISASSCRVQSALCGYGLQVLCMALWAFVVWPCLSVDALGLGKLQAAKFLVVKVYVEL
ncbi:uncharacterized protein SPSK_01230 [Sporothrix schenckii 1099-18]|uniref:Uncharacterized protein n=1 Tax=Sporothrix schenckii 1099-18 TaxID=1397361 RepID=A0A0F2LV37_SPOSC|nr:uncharacterized protein SPSK_01230 [Sporothrix schenckii 1099-18]KJR81327.1 hypothetical protein SPSK_01230 [Sporothrix schenckii 1099-18]